MLYLKYLFILLLLLAADRVWAGGDTLSVAPNAGASEAEPPAPAPAVSELTAPDSAPVPTPELTAPDSASAAPAALVSPINYTGATLSAFIPGGGQFYHKRYLWGGTFLAAEASAIGFAAYWWGEANWRDRQAGWMRDSAAVWLERGPQAGDSTALYRSGFYSVYADRAGFEARQAKYTAYSAISWAAGIHLYGFMDALELCGALSAPRGQERDPVKAGLLSAVPFLGLGQLYNGRPGKAGMLAMTQASLMVTAYGNHRQMSIASDKYNQMRDSTSAQYAYRADHLGYWKGQYDRAFSQRNTFLWISLFAYLYGIFDAVVDAHLSDYDEKVRVGTDLAFGPQGAGVVLNFALPRPKPAK